MTSRKTALLAALCCLYSQAAAACLHFQRAFDGKVAEGMKAAFLFHDGKSAHLVLKTEVHATQGELPPEIAWVVPLPSKPTKYEEVDPALFTELAHASQPASSHSKGVQKLAEKSIALNASSAIKVHETVVAGNYRIQPVEIVADGAAAPFNAWLEANKFNRMPVANQKTYLKKGAVFLAIRAKIKGDRAEFKPLHIVYAADELTFPLKFTHDTRKYDMTLYTLTHEPPKADALKAEFLDYVQHAAYSSKTKAPHLTALLGTAAKGYVTMFRGTALNGPQRKLSGLARDPTLAP